jgi:hypothetical protein
LEALIGVEGHRGRRVRAEGLETLEESVVLHSGVTLLKGVLLTGVVSVDTFSGADGLLDIQGDLGLHLIPGGKVFFHGLFE